MKILIPLLACALVVASAAGGQETPLRGEAPLPPVSPQEVKSLKQLMYEQLEDTSAEDLMRKVMRAHTILGRDGQTALKDRARVRLIQQKSEMAIQRFQANAEIEKVARALESPEVRAGLEKIIVIQDDEQQAEAFKQFLKTHNLPGKQLINLAHLRSAQTALEETDSTLETIEEYLSRETLPFTPEEDLAISDFRSAISKIKEKYAVKKTEASADAPQATDEDLRSILKALLQTSSPRPSAGR